MGFIDGFKPKDDGMIRCSVRKFALAAAKRKTEG